MDKLPTAPQKLLSEKIQLLFDKTVPGDEKQGLVPYYHFRIQLPDETDIGHINFRVGESSHVVNIAGHIGYEIKSEFRGHNLSYYACLALKPFIRTIYPHVILTSDPSNIVSIAIIKKLGAEFIDEIAVPENDPAFATGARLKRRYRWNV